MELNNYRQRDPFIFLSIINTKLRDFNPSLDDLVSEYSLDKEDLLSYMKEHGFTYDENTNQFK